MQNHNESIGALAIHCIDYRFVTNERKFFKEEELKDSYDLIAYPGASKSIYNLFDAVAVSVRLHHPKKFMVIDHEDCGAFGENNSREDHKTSLERAEKLQNVMYPDIPVELYIATFEGVEKI